MPYGQLEDASGRRTGNTMVKRKQCDVISNPTLMISKYKKNMNRANINNNNKTLDKQYTREYISIY